MNNITEKLTKFYYREYEQTGQPPTQCYLTEEEADKFKEENTQLVKGSVAGFKFYGMFINIKKAKQHGHKRGQDSGRNRSGIGGDIRSGVG